MADRVVVWVATELEMPCGRAQQADNNPQRGCREMVRDPQEVLSTCSRLKL